MEIIACGYCDVSDIYDLYFYRDIKNKKIEFLCQFHYNKKISDSNDKEKAFIKDNFRKIVYNEKNENNMKGLLFIDPLLVEIPNTLEEMNLLDDCDIEVINKNEDIIQSIDPITQRFLNKVKQEYESDNDYYEIYKPLNFSELSFVKRLFDSKQEYPIELFYSDKKDENFLYFIIDNDFTDVNFSLGKKIEFSEEPKKIEKLFEIESDNENEEDRRGTPLNSIVVITKIIPIKEEKCNKIAFLPVNINDINYIKHNLGTYIMRESFCEVPYVRMLFGLDSFVNNNSNSTSNLIHSQILGNIDKDKIKDFDKIEMKKIFTENELITKNEE